MPRSLFIIILMLIDRFVVSKVFSLKDTGVYSVGVQFGAIMAYVQESSIKALLPWIYEKLNNQTNVNKTKLVQMCYLYFSALLILALITVHYLPLLMKFFLDSSYNNSSNIISWIVFGYAFNGMTKVMYSFLVFYQKTYYSSIITFWVALTHLVLLYTLLKYNGVIGAAQSLAISLF